MSVFRRQFLQRIAILSFLFCVLVFAIVYIEQSGYQIPSLNTYTYTSAFFREVFEDPVEVTVTFANSTLIRNVTESSANDTVPPEIVYLDRTQVAMVRYRDQIWLFPGKGPDDNDTELVGPNILGQNVPIPFTNRDGFDSNEEVAYLRYLISGVAINKTVIIVPANSAFIRQALNFNCRMRSLGVTNVLFWSLDRASHEILQAYNIVSYYNPTYFSVSGHELYHSVTYLKMMHQRPRFWRNVMRTGYNMLFMDADIAVIKDPMSAIVGDADLEGQADEFWLGWNLMEERCPRMCAGAFYLKANEKSVAMLDYMERLLSQIDREVCEKPDVTDVDGNRDAICEDQEALNDFVKNRMVARLVNRNVTDTFTFEGEDPRLTVRFVSPFDYLSGHVLSLATYVFNSTNLQFHDDAGTPYQNFTPTVVHMNGHRQKEEDMKKFGWWWLNEDLTCAD